MPSVPRRDPGSIKELGPMPDVQVTGGATAETFGGGAAQKATATALEALGTQEIKLAIAQQEGIDRTIANDLSNGMVKAKNDILVEVTQKYKNSKAVETQDFIKNEWDARVRPILDSAPNERVKFLLNKSGSVYKNELDFYGMKHTVTELERYSEKTSKDYVAVKKSDAIQNTLTIDANGATIYNQEATDRNIMEITAETARWADKNNYPRVGTQEETAIFRAALNNDLKEMYMGQINQAVANEQYTIAEQIREQSKDFITGDDAVRVKNLLTREVSNKTIESNADMLVALGEDPIAVAKGFESIPLPQRSATKAEYERKMEQWGTVQNSNAADIAVQIASKSLTKPVELNKWKPGASAPDGVTKEFYRLSEYVLDKNNKFGTDNTTSKNERQRLTEQYGNTFDTNPIERDKKVAKFRNDVFASKTKLKEDDWKALVELSGHKVMELTNNNDVDPRPYINGILNTARMATWPNKILYDTTTFFYEGYIKNGPKKVQESYRRAIERGSKTAGKWQVNLEASTNYEAEEGEDLRVINDLESAAKNDAKLLPGDILVRVKKGPDKGRLAKILKKDYKSEWFELA